MSFAISACNTKTQSKDDIDCVYVWIYIQYLIKNQETNYINKFIYE